MSDKIGAGHLREKLDRERREKRGDPTEGETEQHVTSEYHGCVNVMHDEIDCLAAGLPLQDWCSNCKLENGPADEPVHDTNVPGHNCGCTYVGNNVWDCGHIDQE
jgi:hypothetical protein